jgi:hypothetical protein
MKVVITEDGIVVDGMLLSTTSEMLTFISCHQPKDLEVTLVGVSGIGGFSRDLDVYIGGHSPKDLSVSVGPSYPQDLEVGIGAHLPQDLNIDVYAVAPHDLEVEFWIAHHAHLSAVIDSHLPRDLEVYIKARSILELYAYIGAHPPKDLVVWLMTQKTGTADLMAWLACNATSVEDFELHMHIWGLHDISAIINSHSPKDLDVSIWAWIPRDINVIIDTVFPESLEVNLIPQPEAGVDLRAVHRIFQKTFLTVYITPWTTWRDLSVGLCGLYSYDLSVTYRTGGYSNLYLSIPGTSGYRDLIITLKPSSRVQTTIIPVYTMEIKDLIVSINQGWPCGFNSSYSLLEVYCTPSFFHRLDAIFKVIHGSGTPQLGMYINKPYFDTYFRDLDLVFYLPEDIIPPETVISDSLGLVYENNFDDIFQDIITVTFSWPRFRLMTGYLNLSVYVTPYKDSPWRDLSVTLTALRQEPPIMPPSRPIVQRDGFREPVWPHVFQVNEIELWADDPPELVRKVELMFGEQVREYYWLSKEQRAYAKDVWERWTLMTRGYLPSTEFSGQLDYVTLRELSDTFRYTTIDQALRALINNFMYSSRYDLKMLCSASGSYRNLNVILDIWGRDRFKNLRVTVQPLHTTDLEVIITPV